MNENEEMYSIALTDEFKEKVKTFKSDFYQSYKKISKEETPKVDGSGIKIVDRRPDGYDYITEAYMRESLDKHFPGWSWEMGGTPQFLGGEWVFIWGTLSIIDEHLLAFGINPPIRKFSGTNGVRVKFKRGEAHNPANVIDIGNDVAAANSKALKIAINRLTHIGDDVYRKRIEEEGAGSYETIIENSGDSGAFGHWVEEHKISWAEIMKILEVKSMSAVTDYKEALRKIKEAKGIK